VVFGNKTFTIADDADAAGTAYVGGNFTEITDAVASAAFLQLDKFGEVNAHGSSVTTIDCDNNGTVNFVPLTNPFGANVAYLFPEQTVAGVTFAAGSIAGIDTRLAGDDHGDVGGVVSGGGDIDVSGSLGGSLGIFARNGSILGNVTADDIGDLVAGADIGDGVNAISITSQNDIGRVIAGMNIDIFGSGGGDITAVSGGIDEVLAGGFIDVDTISGQTGIGPGPAVVALGGDITFDQIISPAGNVGDVLAAGDILVHGATGDLAIGGANIEADGSLGKIISGASFTLDDKGTPSTADDEFVFDPTVAPIFGTAGGTIGTLSEAVVIRAGSEGGLIQGPGGVHAIVVFGEASSASPLFQLVSGEDTNDDDLVDTGIVYTFTAERNAPYILPAGTPITAAVFFAIGTPLLSPHYSGITPDMAVVNLQGTDARTDVRVTTRKQTTEEYIAPVDGYYNDDPRFGEGSLADTDMLIDFAGIDVDPEIGAAGAVDPIDPAFPGFFTVINGAPGIQGSLPNSVDGGVLEADVRNLLIEANLGFVDGALAGQGGDIDVEVDPGDPDEFNQPNGIGNINTLFIVGQVVAGSRIDAESVQAFGGAYGSGGANMTAFETAMNTSSISVQVTEAQDIIVIAQTDLPNAGSGGVDILNPGAFLKYNIDDGSMPRLSVDAKTDYNNTLYIGAPPEDASFDITHARLDFIDGNSDGKIQVHELTSANYPTVTLPVGTPAEDALIGRLYHIGRIEGFSPLMSVENAGAAGVGLITTLGGSPSGGEIGFIEWEGNVGGVITVDPDPTDELDAYLGSLSVGLSILDIFEDNDAFTSPEAVDPSCGLVSGSDLGYVDIDGDIGFVRMSHLAPYDPTDPHAGFGHIPLSVFGGDAIPNAPLVVQGEGQNDGDLNLQGIFVTRDILGVTVTQDGNSYRSAVVTRDTVSDSIFSHGEELLADTIWDSSVGVRTADISSVIAGNDIMGDIRADGKIWDNIFAGYYCGGSMGYEDGEGNAVPIQIVASNSDPLNPAPGLGLLDPSSPFFIPDNGTGDIGGDLADYTFNPIIGISGILVNPLYNYMNPGGSEGDDTDTFLKPFEGMVNKDWRSENWNPFPSTVSFTPGGDQLELEDYVGASERVYATLYSDRDITANMVAGEKWISVGAAYTPEEPGEPDEPPPPPGEKPGEGSSIDANRDITGHILTGSDLIADVHADFDLDGIGALSGSIIAGLASQTSLDYLFNFLPDSTGVDMDPSSGITLFYGPGVTDTMFNPLDNYIQYGTEENNSIETADAILTEGGALISAVADPNDPRATKIIGSIDEGGEADYYSFNGQIGETIVVTVVADRVGTFGTGLDPFITLFAPDGQEVATSDMASLNDDGMLEITLPVTGDGDVQGNWYIAVSADGDEGTTGEYCLDVFILPPSTLLTGNIIGEPGSAGTISGAYVGSYTFVDDAFIPTQVIQAGSRASIFGYTDLVPIGSYTNYFIGENDFLNFEGSKGSIVNPIVSTGGYSGANFLYEAMVPAGSGGIDLNGDIFSQDIRAIGGDIAKVHAASDIVGYAILQQATNPVYTVSEIEAVKYGGFFISTYTNIGGVEVPPLTAGTSTGGTIFEVSAGQDIYGDQGNIPGSGGLDTLEINAGDNIYLIKAGRDISDIEVFTDAIDFGSSLPDDIGGLGIMKAGGDILDTSLFLGGAFASDVAIPGVYTNAVTVPNGNPAAIAGVAVNRTTEITADGLADPTIPAGFAFGQIIAGGSIEDMMLLGAGDGGYIGAEGGVIENVYVDLGGVQIDTDGLDEPEDVKYEVTSDGTLWHVFADDDIEHSFFGVTGSLVAMRSGNDIHDVDIWTNAYYTMVYPFNSPAWAGMDGVGGLGVMVAKDEIWDVSIDAEGVFAADINIPADMPDVANPPDETELFDPVIPAGTAVGVVLARGLNADLDGGMEEKDIDNLTIHADGDILLVWAQSGDIEDSTIEADGNIYAVQAGPQEAGADLLTLEMCEDIVNTTITAEVVYDPMTGLPVGGGNVYFVRAFDDIEGVSVWAGNAIGMVIAGDSIDETRIDSEGTFGAPTTIADSSAAWTVVTGLLNGSDAMTFEDRRGVIREFSPLATPTTFMATTSLGWVIALGQESEEVDDSDGISHTNIYADGDLVLVDAAFGDIHGTDIDVDMGSIYRIHAGRDIEFSGNSIEAQGHIVEIEAEDDIRMVSINSDTDDDSVGGIGSVIAGDSIRMDTEIDADGTFVAGTYATAAEAAAMMPGYMKGEGEGVTGVADIISTFASSGKVESREAVINKTGIFTQDVTYAPMAHELGGFATEPVVAAVFGSEWATTGYSIVSVISCGVFDMQLDGIDDMDYHGIRASGIFADGPIDAVVAEKGGLELDSGIFSDAGDAEVPQGGIEFVFSNDDMEDFTIGVEKGNIGVVATRFDMENMEIDADRRGEPMPFVGGNIGIVWAYKNLRDTDIYADGAITGDVAAGLDMRDVFINADLYVDGVFAGQDMVDVTVEADGVDPATNGWDPAGRDAYLFPEGTESGDIHEIRAGDAIIRGVFHAFHDIDVVSAGDYIGPEGPDDGGLTEIWAYTGGIDEISAFGDGLDAVDVLAGAMLADETKVFQLINGATVFQLDALDTTGAPTYFGGAQMILKVAGDYAPLIALAGVQTDSTSYLNLRTSDDNLWEVAWIDVDPIAEPDVFFWNMMDEGKMSGSPDGFAEANIHQLYIEGFIDALGGADVGGGNIAIDFDSGLAPNNVGDMGYLYVEGWFSEDTHFQAESLGVFGTSDGMIVYGLDRGEAQFYLLPSQVNITELLYTGTNEFDTDNVTNVDGPILIAAKADEPSAYFFTTAGSPFGQYGDVFYLTASEDFDAAATVSYVDGTGASAPYAIGDVFVMAPGAAGFEATQGIKSFTMEGAAPEYIGNDTFMGPFIEAEGSIGEVKIFANRLSYGADGIIGTADDVLAPNAVAHLASVSAGFWIGEVGGRDEKDGTPEIGYDDPIVPASWVSAGGWEPDLFPDVPFTDADDFTSIVNPGPDGEYGTSDDFIIAGGKANIVSVYVEGDIQDTRTDGLPFAELGIGKLNIEIAASGSLTGNAEGMAIVTKDVVSPQESPDASRTADFESVAVGDDILGSIDIDGRITGMIWAGLGKIISLGNDGALSHEYYSLGSGGFDVLDLNDDVWELMPGDNPFYEPAFNPYVQDDFGANVLGLQAMGSGQIGAAENPVTIHAAEEVVGDPWFDETDGFGSFDFHVSSIQGPDGVYASIHFDEAMVDYDIVSIRGPVGAPGGETIDLDVMVDSKIIAGTDLYGPVTIEGMIDSFIGTGQSEHYLQDPDGDIHGDLIGPTTIGWMDDSCIVVDGDHLGNLTVDEMDHSNITVKGEVASDVTIGDMYDGSMVGINDGIRGNLTVDSMSGSSLYVGGVDGNSSIGSMSSSYASVGTVGGESSVGSMSDSSFYAGSIGFTTGDGNSYIGDMTDSYASIGEVAGNSTVGDMESSDFYSGSIGFGTGSDGNSSVGDMNDSSVTISGSVAGNSYVGDMYDSDGASGGLDGSIHTITGNLNGDGVITSMADNSLWEVLGSALQNVSVLEGMLNSTVMVGVDLVGNFNVGVFCTVPAVVSMVGSKLWVGHNIGGVNIEGDIENSDIVAYTGSIGDVNVGDDIDGGIESGESNIYAEAGIGNVTVMDSILGDVEIVAISGPILDITVGGNVNKNPGDVDGMGISGVVDIVGKLGIGDITIVEGMILGDVDIIAGISPSVSGLDTPAGEPDFNLTAAVLPGRNIGDITVTAGSFVSYGYSEIIATGAIGSIFVGGDLDATYGDVYISSASIDGLAVMGDMTTFGFSGGGDIVIETGAFNEYDGAVPLPVAPAAIAVGGNMMGTIAVNAATIGAGGNALTVGFSGFGSVMADTNMFPFNGISLTATGDIGDIAVMDLLGNGPFFGHGDIFITSFSGSVGNIVAGAINGGPGGNVFVSAEMSIGDIVAIDDAVIDVFGNEIGSGIRELHLTVTNPFGSIGDIISHGDIDVADVMSWIELDTFDGSIGDIVSLVGSVSLYDLTFGGSIGDVFASECVIIEDMVLEAGNLAADGTIGVDDPSLGVDQSVTVLDGLGRVRYDGAPVDGITSEIGSVRVIGNYVGGDIGNMTAFDEVAFENNSVGGDVGNMTSVNYYINVLGNFVTGNMGNIDAFNNVILEENQIGGNVGDISGNATDWDYNVGVYLNDLLIGGNMGNITGASVEGDGVWIDGDVLIMGNVGNITGTANESCGVHIEEAEIMGVVGDIVGTSVEGPGVGMYGTLIGGAGNITGVSVLADGVDMYGVNVTGSIQSIFGSSQDDDGVDIEDILVGGSIVGGITGSTGEGGWSNGVQLDDVKISGDLGGITAPMGDIAIREDVLVGGNIGDVVAVVGSVYTDEDEVLVAHGSIGNIVAGGEICGIFAAETGSIGNIAAYALDIYDSYFSAGTDIGDVVALMGEIYDVDIHANGSIGDVYASFDIGGWYSSGGADVCITAETGSIGDGAVFVGTEEAARENLPGGVVSAAGDIRAEISAGYDIYNVYAMKVNYLDPADQTLMYGGNILDGTRITAGHDIGKLVKDAQGNVLENRGVIAGGAIEDDVAIIAGNNIGVVEANIIGFGFDDINSECYQVWDEWSEETTMTFIKIQVPDNDGMLDNNDYLMFTDVNGDGVIQVPAALTQAIAEIDAENSCTEGYVPILADCKLSNPEFDMIVTYLGQHPDMLPLFNMNTDELESLPTLPDWYNSQAFNFGELKVEDVDNIIIMHLDGYYDEYDIFDAYGNLNSDGKPDGIFLDGNGNEMLDVDYYGNPTCGDEFVTFNYDVPNLPLVFIDHITTMNSYAYSYWVTETSIDPAATLTIIAKGKDPASDLINNGRAIGRIGGVDEGIIGAGEIFSNVFISAEKGGIGEISASGDVGVRGGLANALDINAQTAVDAIFAGGSLGTDYAPIDVDVAGAGPRDVITLDMLEGDIAGTWMEYNGVGVEGGVLALGDINMNINTGASIGAVQAFQGTINGEFNASGNMGVIYGGKGIDATLTADLGRIASVYAPKGDIYSNIFAGGGIGYVTAVSGNVAGSIFSGGDILGIDEAGGAAKGDVSIAMKLINGHSSYIGAIETGFALSDSVSGGSDAYALIQTDDGFGVGTIVIKNSRSTTSFAIETDGRSLVDLDRFVVDGDFANLSGLLDGTADANIASLEIDGALYGTAAVDGVINYASVEGGIICPVYDGEELVIPGGKIITDVLDATTFTYEIANKVDTVTVTGGDWRVTVECCNIIDANLSRYDRGVDVLTFTTSSDLNDLNANLGDRDLELVVGGDVIGDVRIHSGDLDLTTDNLSGDIEVIAGTLSLDVIGNILAGADADADGGIVDFAVGGTIDPSVGGYVRLDTNKATSDPDHVTTETGQVISVVGSSKTATADVFVVFDNLVTDVQVGGKGTLVLTSTGIAGESDIKDGINVSHGSKIAVKSVLVDGDLGGFVNTNTGAKVTNITASGDIGNVLADGLVQNINAGGDIGHVRSLCNAVNKVFAQGDIESLFANRNVQNVIAGGDIGSITSLSYNVYNVAAGGDIDTIFAKSNVKNVSADGRIGEIMAGKSVNIVSATEIGTINCVGGTVSNISATEDIDMINGAKVTKVSVGGSVNVAATKASYITAGGLGHTGPFAGGTVELGTFVSKISSLHISPNIDITVTP